MNSTLRSVEIVTSSKDVGPAIYLVNQVSGHGHLDMYAKLYSKALLEAGYRVVLLSQNDPGFEAWYEANHPDLAPRFRCFTRDGVRDPLPDQQAGAEANKPPPGFLARWWERGARRIGGAFSQIGKLCRTIVRDSGAVMRTVRADGVEAVRDVVNPKRHDPLPFGIPFDHLTSEIRLAEAHSRCKPQLIIFLYLDMMSQTQSSCAALDELGVPWAGIRFHPNGSYRKKFRGERFFLTGKARGAIFLNPNAIPAYRRKFPGLHFAGFPDVTDTTTLTDGSPFVSAVRERAGDRKIVLQLGSLSPHKGIFELISLIKQANPKRFFFVICGEMFWSNYGEREQELRDFIENPPENCMVRLGYLEDERELNSLVQACDCLYAVYKGDFYNSSNTMTKAAVFERPILVNDKFLMGQRVREYNLGEVVRAGDIDDTIFWLEDMMSRPKSRFGFEAFRRAHSHEALSVALSSVVPRWLAN